MFTIEKSNVLCEKHINQYYFLIFQFGNNNYNNFYLSLHTIKYYLCTL